jgi:hypothetical protein
MYDFLTLSPLDFEELIRDLLQAELHVRLESFGPGPDQGIDFRHSTGSRGIIVQAKHYGRSGTNKLLRAARMENGKVNALGPAARRYILATSVSLSPGLTRRIAEKRNSLYQDEHSRAHESYQSTPAAPTIPEMTTDQIRSMLAGIR